MKIASAGLIAALSLLTILQAQTDPPVVMTNDALLAAQPAPPVQSLDSLLGPIALYPDALIALILPASTHSSDVVLAARYIDAKGDPDQAASQPWDDSVKALIHYPSVLTWMDDNLAWTQALGDAFAAQPADVMNAVQRLRTQARAAGTLVDSPQQHVLTQGSDILIVPAQPEVIYVPVYDPETVYISRTVWVHRPLITFTIGYPRSSWLIYDCNWQHHNVWAVSRPPGRYQPQWNRPINPTPHRPRSPVQPGLPNGFQPRPWNAPRPAATPNNRPSTRLIPPDAVRPGAQPGRALPTTPFRPVTPPPAVGITPPIPRNRPNLPNSPGFPQHAPGVPVNRAPAPAVHPVPSTNPGQPARTFDDGRQTPRIHP